MCSSVFLTKSVIITIGILFHVPYLHTCDIFNSNPNLYESNLTEILGSDSDSMHPERKPLHLFFFRKLVEADEEKDYLSVNPQ